MLMSQYGFEEFHGSDFALQSPLNSAVASLDSNTCKAISKLEFK